MYTIDRELYLSVRKITCQKPVNDWQVQNTTEVSVDHGNINVDSVKPSRQNSFSLIQFFFQMSIHSAVQLQKVISTYNKVNNFQFTSSFFANDRDTFLNDQTF